MRPHANPAIESFPQPGTTEAIELGCTCRIIGRFRYSSNLPVFFWFPTQIAPFTPRPLGPRNSIEARSLAPAVRARPLPAAGALRASACERRPDVREYNPRPSPLFRTKMQ